MFRSNNNDSSDQLILNFRHIAALYFALAIVGFMIRIYLIIGDALVWSNLLNIIRRAVFISHHDILILSICSIIASIIAYALKNSKIGSKIFRTLLMIMAILYAIILAGNIIALYWLNIPLTYQWIYYADLAQSYTPQTAISSAMSANSTVYFILSIIAFFIAFCLSRRFLHIYLVYFYGALLPIYLVHGFITPAPKSPLRDEITNPVYELIASAWASRNNSLLEMETKRIDPSYIYRSEKLDNDGLTIEKKNIIMIVLESVSAKAVYDHSYSINSDLKNIAKLRNDGVSFTSFHAPKPQSTRAIFSFLSGRYPKLSYRAETQTLADKNIILFPSILRDNGYDTSFFMGAEFAFQDVDKFINGKGFNELFDIENIDCDIYRDIENKKYKNINNISSECAVNKFIDWKKNRSERPYFSILWLNDTHFPYYPKDINISGNQNKYKAAIKDADAHIGNIIDDLEKNGQYENTVLIIFSDHGEAFGEHGNYTHGSSVYDEETRIPLIIANSEVVDALGFTGKDNDNLSDQSDFAPLMLEIAGINGDYKWQGSNPLQRDWSNNVYLMSSLRGNKVGLITNQRMKYIYDLRHQIMEKYNLKLDPNEKKPLDIEEKERIRVIKDMAAWAQYNHKLYEN